MPHELLKIRNIDLGFSFAIALRAMQMEADAVKQARIEAGLDDKDEDPHHDVGSKIKTLFGD